MNMSQDFQEFVKFFFRRIKFLMVGRCASAAYDHPAYTKDLIDGVLLWPESAYRIISEITEPGFGNVGLASKDSRKPDVMVQLSHKPQCVDILSFAIGLHFPDSCKSRVYVLDAHFQSLFISGCDLWIKKLVTYPLRDLAGLADLPMIQKLSFLQNPSLP